MVTIKRTMFWEVLIVMGSRIEEKWSFRTFSEARIYARELAQINKIKLELA